MAAAAYAAALAALGLLPRWGAALAAAALAGIAAWAYGERREKADLVFAAWPALHLLLFLTGSLASPLIALAAAWVVALARFRPRAGLAAAVFAALIVPLIEWLHVARPPVSSLLRYELLIGLAAAYAATRRGTREPRAPRKIDAAEEPAAGPGRAEDAEVMAAALELVLRATDAHEAALWRMAPDGSAAHLEARAATRGVPAPEPAVALEGHPFAWAILEQQHLHLQRGKRDLPARWAEEMLLIPVDLPEGVLALGFPGGVPPGADRASSEAGKHLSALAALLRGRRDADREDARVRAIADAAQTLPAEIEVEAFARRLAAIVRQGTGAAGAAVALGLDEAGRGRILHVDDTGPAPRFADGFGEDESRLALALKHGIDLSYEDLRRERDRLPLCTPGEEWGQPPRSASVFPLMADGRALGAVVAWHPEPGRFGERETELLRRICALAPMPLRRAREYHALDVRAHTDALTSLPNRGAFEERLVTLSHVFDRYARPFSLLVLDVDFFKKFNDTHGHEAGDRVLQHVANLLRLSVRDVDLPARLGGEEFVVLMPETALRPAAEVAERVRRAVEGRPLVWNGRSLPVTISIGAAACPDCTHTPAEVLKLADEALYRAKGAGRNRVSQAPRVGRAPEVPGD